MGINAGLKFDIAYEFFAPQTLSTQKKSLRPRLHKQIKPPLFAQVLNPYEVTPNEFAQIKYVLFARVNAA